MRLKIVIVVVTAVVIFGTAYYFLRPAPQPSGSVTTNTTTSVSPNTNRNPVPIENTSVAPTASWRWESLGCGSQAPCTYRVCLSTDSAVCYSCVGISTTNTGERRPTADESPLTTNHFTCQVVRPA